MTKAMGYMTDYYFNFNVEIWMQSQDVWEKYRGELGDKLKVVKNEDLHADLEKQMHDVASWLGVDFHESMLESTFSGISWMGDSSYLPKEEDYPEALDIYYLPENVKKRWMKELSSRETLMTEFLTNDLMRDFGYKRMTKDNLLTRIKGLLIYLMPHRGLFQRWLRLYPHLEEFDRVSRNLGEGLGGGIWKRLPKPLKFFGIVMMSVLLRIRIYFFPGNRRKRYV
jgi:hypothetical protein